MGSRRRIGQRAELELLLRAECRRWYLKVRYTQEMHPRLHTFR